MDPVPAVDLYKLIAYSSQAVATIGVAIVFFYRRGKLKETGFEGCIRAHFRDLFATWLILGSFFAFEAVAYLVIPRDLSGGVRTVATPLVHALQIFVCVVTNLYLRRATLQLDFYHYLGSDDPPPAPIVSAISSDALSTEVHVEDAPAFVSGIRQWLSIGHRIDAAVVWSGTVEIGYFLLLAGLRIPMTPFLYGIGLFPQLVLTGGLLLWLGIVYLDVRASRVLWVASFLYSAVHLLSVMISLSVELTPMHIGTAGLKLVFGGFVLGTGKLFRIPRVDQEGILTSAHFFATRRRSRRRLHWAASMLGLWTACLVGTYSVVEILRASPVGIGWRIGLGLAVLAVAGQGVLFLFKKFGAYRIRWAHHSRDSIRHIVEYNEHEEPGRGWKHEVLGNWQDAGPEGGNVVLFHGLLGNGPKTWGLLPLILLREPGVSRVHLLTYQHGFLRFNTRLMQLPDEVVLRVEHICNTYSGPVYIFAHSLGAMLITEAYSRLSPAVLRRLRLVCLVAPPLRGSKMALLGYPWIKSLRPGSSYTRRVEDSFKERFAIVNRDGVACRQATTISVFCGSQDEVVGDIARTVGLPVSRKLAEHHGSITAPYALDGELGQAYVGELRRTSPLCNMLRVMWGIMGGQQRLAAGWVMRPRPELHRVDIEEELDPDIGDIVPLSGVRYLRQGGNACEEVLRSWASSICGLPIPDRDRVMVDRGVSRLRRFLLGELGEYPIVRVSWFRDRTLYAMRNDGHALVVVANEESLVKLRGTEA